MEYYCYLCDPTCGAVIGSLEQLSSHLRSVHLKYYPYHCGMCMEKDIVFRTHCTTALLRHTKRDHAHDKINIIYNEDANLETELESLLDQCCQSTQAVIKNEPVFESGHVIDESTIRQIMSGSAAHNQPGQPIHCLTSGSKEENLEWNANSVRSSRSVTQSPTEGALAAISLTFGEQKPPKALVVRGPMKTVMTEFCLEYAHKSIKHFSFGSQFTPELQAGMVEEFYELYALRAPEHPLTYDQKTIIKKLTRQIKERRREIHMDAITQYSVQFGQSLLLRAKNALLNLTDNFEVMPDYGDTIRASYMIEVRIMHLPDPAEENLPDYVYAIVVNLGTLCESDKNVTVGDFSYNYCSLYSPAKIAVKLDWLYPKGTFTRTGDAAKNRRQCRSEPVDTAARSARNSKRRSIMTDDNEGAADSPTLVHVVKKYRMQQDDPHATFHDLDT